MTRDNNRDSNRDQFVQPGSVFTTDPYFMARNNYRSGDRDQFVCPDLYLLQTLNLWLVIIIAVVIVTSSCAQIWGEQYSS
jgi:hypothetical protein